MKKIIYTTFVLATLFLPQSAGATTFINSGLSGKNVWTKEDSPYVVSGRVTLQAGSELEVEQGVSVKFMPSSEIFAEGRLNVRGTQREPVYFSSAYDTLGSDIYNDCDELITAINTGDGPDQCSNDAHYDESSSGRQWAGIYLNQSEMDLSHAVFSHAARALKLQSSSATIDGLEVNHSGSGLQLNDSAATTTDTKFDTVAGEAVSIGQHSTMLLSSSTIEHIYKNFAIVSVDADVRLEKVTINDAKAGGIIAMSGNVTVDDSRIDGGSGTGIETYIHSLTHKPLKLSLNHTLVSGFDRAVRSYGGNVEISTSSIAHNKAGITNQSATEINASRVWWGEKSGPYSTDTNPQGKGDSVSSGVTVTPWLESDPLAVPKCCSSIAFIPGVEGSRLYRQKFLHEDQLWEPNISSDVQELYLDNAGKSVLDDVYTRDVIDRTFILHSDIYASFLEYLAELKNSRHEIADFAALPYDWRLGPEEIVSRGREDRDGKVNFSGTLAQDEVPYLVANLEKLRKNSITGNVSIVAHSYGGIVAKALLNSLMQMKTAGTSDLIDHIDNLILVSSPQLGTPESVLTLLHGYNQSALLGIVMDSASMRTLADRSLAAHVMLPSKSYFASSTPIIEIDPSVDDVSSMRTFYGSTTTTYAALRAFLSDTYSVRKQPEVVDPKTPTVLMKSFLNDAEAVHDEYDHWIAPANVKVSQIAGWGRDTVSAARYSSRICPNPGYATCIDFKYLDYSPITTAMGDGTVMAQSSLAMPAQNYYFNLHWYNYENDKNIDHSRIMSTSAIKDAVEHLISGNPQLPSHVTTYEPAYDWKSLVLSIHSPVEMTITSPSGRQLTTSTSTLAASDIPNSTLMRAGEGHYAFVPEESGYSVKLSGTGSGVFSFDVDEVGPSGQINLAAFDDLPVSASTSAYYTHNALATSSLLIDVDGDGTIDANVSSESIRSLSGYLKTSKELMKKMTMSTAVRTLLEVKIDSIIKSIEKGRHKSLSARSIKKLAVVAKVAARKNDLKFEEFYSSFLDALKDYLINAR